MPTTKTEPKKKIIKSERLYFTVTGEFLTETARDTWVSDIPKKAINILTEGVGMTKEQALLVCNGKAKLTGKARIGTDDTLGFADDNKTEKSGIKLDTETMIARLERKYISLSESINLYAEAPDEVLSDDDDDQDEYREKMKNGITPRLKEVLENLECLYPVVGKSMKDLPAEKVRSFKKIRQESVAEGERQSERAKKEKEEKLMQERKKFTTKPCSIKVCAKNNINAGWLLPDGTFYGGDGFPFIHIQILKDLYEVGFFKKLKYGNDEESVEDNGWIKFTGGSWHPWEHKNPPTKEQVEFMIDYTVEIDKSDSIRIVSNNISLKAFATLLDGAPFNTFQLKLKSEEIANAEKLLAPRSNTMFGGIYYIVPLTVERCKEENLLSGWLLPDGTFYGGKAYPFVHNDILCDLKDETDLFKDKDYPATENAVQQHKWIRLSGSYGWQITDAPSKEQVQFIIDYTITVHERDKLTIFSHHITLKKFATLLDGAKFDLSELENEDEA